MTSLWHHLSFLQTIVHISNSIEPRNFVLGTNTQQRNVHLMITMKVTLTDDDGHRWRSKVTTKELMVISRKLLHSQTSYLVPRNNTRRDIEWHKPFWPSLKVKVTTQGQRSQTWRCLRSLDASCYYDYYDFFIYRRCRARNATDKKVCKRTKKAGNAHYCWQHGKSTIC